MADLDVAEALAGHLHLRHLGQRPVGEVEVHDHVLGPADLDQPLDDAGREGLGDLEEGIAGTQAAHLGEGDGGHAHGHALDGAGHRTRHGHVLGDVGAAIDARQHEVGLGPLDQFAHPQHDAVGRGAGDGEAARIDGPHPHGIGERQGPRGARLFVFRGADPDVVRQLPGDPLQRRQALGMDSVVVGQQDSHAAPPMRVRPPI